MARAIFRNEPTGASIQVSGSATRLVYYSLTAGDRAGDGPVKVLFRDGTTVDSPAIGEDIVIEPGETVEATPDVETSARVTLFITPETAGDKGRLSGTVQTLRDSDLVRVRDIEDIAAEPGSVSISIPDRTPSGITGYNSQAFAQDTMWSENGYQFLVFVSGARVPHIGRRGYGGRVWSFQDFSAVTGNPLASPVDDDSHNVLSMGIDGSGYVHVAGNMHNHDLRYVTSTEPWGGENFDQWEAGSMIGTEEASVTYPQFVRLLNGDLLFFYRGDGGSGNGNHYVNRLDHTTQTWSRIGMLIDGQTDDRSAYPHRVCVDPRDGTIHVAWEWRIDIGGSFPPAHNHDPSYARSRDGGDTWETSDGTEYTLPIRHADAEKIETVEIDNQLSNQGGAVVDSDGNFHVSYLRERTGASTARTLHHAVLSEDGWTVNDLGLGWSRTQMFEYRKNIYIVGQRATDGARGTVRILDVNNPRGNYAVYNPGTLGNWEPQIDHTALRGRGDLNVYVQASSEVGNDDYFGSQNWLNSQQMAIVTFPLHRLDHFAKQVIPVPGMKVIGEASTATEFTVTETTTSPTGIALFIDPDHVDKNLHVRWMARGLVSAASNELRVAARITGGSDLGRGSITAQSEVLRWSPWIPLDSVSGGDVLHLVAGHVSGADVATLTAGQLQLGYIATG